MALVASFRKDRNAYGGGVIIYTSNNVRVTRRNDLEPANVELVWLEIDNPTSQIFLCFVYRPPSADSSFWRNFSWSLDKACELSDKIIIVGDINVDLFNTPDTHAPLLMCSEYVSLSVNFYRKSGGVRMRGHETSSSSQRDVPEFLSFSNRKWMLLD